MIFCLFSKVAKCVAVVVVTSALLSVAFRWVTPPMTAFMLADRGSPQYQFVSNDHISRRFLAAVLVHEDINLGPRTGPFDLAAFIGRARAHLGGQEDPGGSTIPQQLVKNIFLWRGGGAFRKAIEAALATEFAFSISDARLLELYVNYAQFGAGLYGVCAASWYYFDQPPSMLDDDQSAQLVGLLPLPDLVQRQIGGGIYLGPDANPKAVDLINGSKNVWLPTELANNGGWQAVVRTVGITDTAADHAGDVDDDSCSSMPEDVSQRLQQEDPTYIPPSDPGATVVTGSRGCQRRTHPPRKAGTARSVRPRARGTRRCDAGGPAFVGATRQEDVGLADPGPDQDSERVSRTRP
ncbi:Transglycosylase (plasmid) [Mycobacterium sp. JS623]|uniref:transglycosylase domain-containing protein n=1 Tax=Mycobacterium sp. JS623 TaxID=212767 RepID=UPI0002A583BD|nr:transglycosylase domain-containing protein [Mycobacterium sp. JS623]AGB27098.1 Transglycosylase [Mycobacterium sp. JS623]